MATVYDVPAEKLIENVAEKLKKDPIFEPPEWADVVKTGMHTEKAPVREDWWHVRAAAILRKVYTKGPIGLIHLSTEYGGARDRRNAPNQARTGSRAVLRNALHQLEKAGYVTAKKGKGRIITPLGQKLLDNSSYEVLKELVKSNPELAKI